MSEVNSKKMFSWINPKLEVRDTDECGMGVFANEIINKGEKLAVFGGYILNIRELSNLSDEFSDSGIQISEDLSIISLNHLEDTDFFNHSCDPNAGINGQIFLVSIRDISVDEEVTFDYAMCLHECPGIPEYKFECKCKSSHCRGLVTENDWKIIDLQKKYDGYFQYFLQEKINNIKNKNDLS